MDMKSDDTVLEMGLFTRYMLSIIAQHQLHISEIVNAVPCKPNGVMPSEMIAFLALALDRQVNLIIESGRRYGQSTECFSALCETISIDCDPVPESDREIAYKYPTTLRLHSGNGEKMVPSYVTRHVGRRIALFLDGPKGVKAYNVISAVRNNIVFGAIHDLSCYSEKPGGRQENASRTTVARDTTVWFSDDPIWINSIRQYDERAWRGSYASREEMTACGFTIGVMPGGMWERNSIR